jgi:hypothetical protein
MATSLQKHTLNLREGDFEYLQQVFGPNGLSASVAIRHIVSRHVDHLRAQEDPVDIRLEFRNE